MEAIQLENQTLKARLKASEAEAAGLRARLAELQARIQQQELAAEGLVSRSTSDGLSVRRPEQTAGHGSRADVEAPEVAELFGASMGSDALPSSLDRRCVAELRKQVAQGAKLAVSDDQVVALVDIVRVYLLAEVAGECRCLIEHECFDVSDGKQMTVMLPPAVRLRPGEDWQAAVGRALSAHFGIEECWQDSLFQVDVGSYYSYEETAQLGTFSNLMKRTTVHEVHARVVPPAELRALRSNSCDAASLASCSQDALDRAGLLGKLGLPSGRDFITKSEDEAGVLRLHVWGWKSREHEKTGKFLAFSRYLEARGYNVSEFGTGSNRSLFQFYVEVKEKQIAQLVEMVVPPGEARKGERELVRVVDLLKIRLVAEIHGRLRELSESERFLDDGSSDKAAQLLVKKMRQGSDWREVWKEAIHDLLHIPPDLQEECFRVDEARNQYQEEVVLDPCYAGIRSMLKVRTVVIDVLNPEHPDLYHIGLPRGNDFVTREAERHGPGGEVHVWTWAPCDGQGAGHFESAIEDALASGTAFEQVCNGLYAAECLIIQANSSLNSLGMDSLFKQVLHRVQWCSEKISNIDATVSDMDVPRLIRAARKSKEIAHVDEGLADFIATNFTQASQRTPMAGSPAEGAVALGGISRQISSEKALEAPSEEFKHMLSSFPCLQEFVGGRDSWGFDFFELDQRSGHRVLESYGSVVTVPLCCRALKCDRALAQGFLDKVVAGYYTNPYHNALHAAQVCHLASWIARCLGITDVQTDVERCAFVIAALGHDLRHFGRTNAFCVNTEHVLSLRYNNQKVLENMHSATCLELLESVQLLSNLSRAERNMLRAHIIEYILATDMAEHFEVISKFRVRKDAPDFSISTEADRRFVSRLCIKAGDIGHSALPWAIHKQWSIRVAEEFFAQGDEEQRLGLPVSALCDRSKLDDFGTSQKGFLEFVSMPLFEVLAVLQVDLESSSDRMIATTSLGGLTMARSYEAPATVPEAVEDDDVQAFQRRRHKVAVTVPGSVSRANSYDNKENDCVVARRRARQYTAPARSSLVRPGVFTRSIRGVCITELEANACRWVEDDGPVNWVKEALPSKVSAKVEL